MASSMPDFAMPSDEEVAAARRMQSAAGAEWLDDDGGGSAAAEAHELVSGARHPAAASTRARPTPPTHPASGLQRALQRVRDVARNPLVAFAAGAAVVAAGFVAAPTLTEASQRGSLTQLHDVLDAYATAVSTGDVETALAMHVPDPDEASLALLDAGVEPSEPATLDCDDPVVSGAGDVAFASCELAIAAYGGYPAPSRLRLDRVDGAWRLGSGVEQGSFVGGTLFDVTAIAGVPTDGLVDDADQPYWLLPGSYELETQTSDLIEVIDYGGLIVADGGGVNAGVVLADSVLDDVSAQVVDWVRACLADTADACGLPPVRAGLEPDPIIDQSGYPLDATTYSMPVRLGNMTSTAPTIEVRVVFDEGRTSYVVDIVGATDRY